MLGQVVHGMVLSCHGIVIPCPCQALIPYVMYPNDTLDHVMSCHVIPCPCQALIPYVMYPNDTIDHVMSCHVMSYLVLVKP